MKKLLTVLLAVIWQISYAQSKENHTIHTLNAIWKNTDDTTIISLLNNGKYLDILHTISKTRIIESGIYGFCNTEIDIDEIEKKDLNIASKEGSNLCFIDNEGVVLSYELEYGCSDNNKRCSMLLFGQNVFKYNTIPMYSALLKFLYKQGKVDKQDYLKEYANLIVKEVASTKSIIHQSPNVTTKMYLIKGDLVSVLEQKGDWVKIEYQGKKIIQGWLKKEDIK